MQKPLEMAVSQTARAAWFEIAISIFKTTFFRQVRGGIGATHSWISSCSGVFRLALIGLTLACPLDGAIIRGPYLQSLTPTSVIVRWRTDVPTDSRVRYGTEPTRLVRNVERFQFTTEHEVQLTELSPGSKHYYAVGSRTLAVSAGDAGSFFTTPPHPSRPRPTRIWVIGDFGTGDSNQIAVRDSFYSFTGSRDPDVWITVGDNAYPFGRESDFQSGFFNPYASLLKRVAIWPALGNHDTATTKNFNENYPYFGIFSLPKAAEAGGAPSGTERYYSFDHGDIHFICLDTQLEPLTANGAMANWLRADLAAQSKKWLIAYCHHPPYSRGSHNSDSAIESLQFRQNFVPILEAAGVDLVLTGHSHNYERSFLINGHYGLSTTLTPTMVLDAGSGRADGTGSYFKPETRTPNSGTVYAVVGNSGALWGGGTLDHPAVYSSFGANVLGSMVIDVEGNRLDARFIRHNGQVGDYFTIQKSDNGPLAPPISLVTPFDTSRTLDLPGNHLLSFQISRPPNRGRLIGWNSSTGQATYVPARGYHGPDSFDYQVTNQHGRSSIGTVDITIQPALDMDGDGLLRSWKTATGVTDPAADSDEDQWPNRMEWLAGTDPRNASSHPKIQSVEPLPVGRRVRWSAIGGARYRVSYSDNLSSFTELIRPIEQEMPPLANGTTGTAEFVDDHSLTGPPPTSGLRFYRLTVIDPAINASPSINLTVAQKSTGPTGRAADLIATVADSDRDSLRVSYYGRIATQPPGPDFSLIMMPDTQYYTDGTKGGQPDSFFSQTDWIVRNRMARNIAYVIQLGDCTNRGDHSPLNLAGKPIEWEIASKALYRLEDPTRTQLNHGVPYGIAVGNHDQIPSEDPDGTTLFYNRYFGVNHFSPKSYYGGNFGIDNDNHYQLFEAGGLKFIVVTTEYDNKANPAVLAWADQLLKTHADRRAIVCSHRFLREDGVLQPQGVATYEALKQNPNLFMMLCGHHDGESHIFRTFEGRTVTIMMANYQQRVNGGDGWMRILRFSPANNRIYAETYSPKLDQFETDGNSRFSFPYSMQATAEPFALLDTPQGNNTGTIEWTGLLPGRTYQCYATASDGVTTATTPTQSFQTMAAPLPQVSDLVVQVPYNTPTSVTLTASGLTPDSRLFAIERDPSHGSISNFDYRTGSFLYTPAQGFSGSDSLLFRVSDGERVTGSATANFQIAPPVDQNQNGLADDWEHRFGVSNPDLDPDSDGKTNREEFIAGTNPTARESALSVVSWGLTPFLQNPSRLRYTLRWKAVAGVQYRIQYSDANTGLQFRDLVRPLDDEIVQGVPGTETIETFTDDYYYTGTAPAEGRRFFRVKVIR